MLLFLISTTGLEVLAVLQASGSRQHTPTRILHGCSQRKRGKRNQVGDAYTLVSLLFLTKVTLLDPATPSCSGDYMVLCALDDHQLQQVQLLSWKSVKILLQSCSAGMLPRACSHICVWRNNKGLLSVGLAPSSCSGHQLGDYVLINLGRC